MSEQIPSDAQYDPLVAQFLNWEQASRDTIDFKKAYVDMAGDLVAGLVLSQIVYWHLPGRNGVTRLRISKDGQQWIAKRRQEWWEEIRITAKQLDRALKILEDKQLIVTALYHFNRKPTKHIRLNWSGFMKSFNDAILLKGQNEAPILPKGENEDGSIFPKGKNAISPKVKLLLTENTDQRLLTTSASDDASVATEQKPIEVTPKVETTSIAAQGSDTYYVKRDSVAYGPMPSYAAATREAALGGTVVQGQALPDGIEIRPTPNQTLAANKKQAAKKQPASPRPRNAVFDAIALGSFHLTKVGNEGGRIGKVEKGVRECTETEHLDTLAQDLTAMYAWYKKTKPTLSTPAEAHTICKYLAEWRESAPRATSGGTAPAVRYVIEPDDDYVAPGPAR